MMGYKYYQPNDKDISDSHYDDPIRALTKLLDMSWLEVFDDLVPIQRDLQVSFNTEECYIKYLQNNGFAYVGISNKRGSKRPTVEQFARETRNSGKKYFVNIAHHNVAVMGGVYYNTWDCGDKCLYGYWETPL